MNRVFAPHSQSYRYYQQQRRLYVLVPVPYHPCHVDQFHPDRYYRFMNMEHPRLYNDIINVMMYDREQEQVHIIYAVIDIINNSVDYMYLFLFPIILVMWISFILIGTIAS